MSILRDFNVCTYTDAHILIHTYTASYMLLKAGSSTRTSPFHKTDACSLLYTSELTLRPTGCRSLFPQLHLRESTTAVIIIAKPGWVIALYFPEGFQTYNPI